MEARAEVRKWKFPMDKILEYFDRAQVART